MIVHYGAISSSKLKGEFQFIRETANQRKLERCDDRIVVVVVGR